MPLISFSFLIAMARTPNNTMLNGSVDSVHPCLILVIRGKALSFSSLSVMLAVDLSYIGLYHVDILSSVLIIKGC